MVSTCRNLGIPTLRPKQSVMPYRHCIRIPLCLHVFDRFSLSVVCHCVLSASPSFHSQSTDLRLNFSLGLHPNLVNFDDHAVSFFETGGDAFHVEKKMENIDVGSVLLGSIIGDW